MSDPERGQITASAADVYEQFFLPALFEQWVVPVADAAWIGPGHSVLDVACGTGVLARHVSYRVGAAGSVVGLDLNDGMLNVARREAPGVRWHHGSAERLPFPDDRFDAVVSQFGLMFFSDPVEAIRQMYRVVRPGGRIAVAVWDTLEQTPGYAAVTALLEELFDRSVADALRAPYTMGDRGLLERLFTDAGVPGFRVDTLEGTARFPSIQDWMHTDIKGWTLSTVLNDQQFGYLLGQAEDRLAEFVTEDGKVRFSAPAHIVSATKPDSP